jgi:cobalt-precorrin 5A hydrolase
MSVATIVVAGVGCRAGCSAADIVAAVHLAVSRAGVEISDVIGLCSAEFKAGESGLERAADLLEKPLRLVPTVALAARASQALTASNAVARRFALPSIAETAALAGAAELGGRGARARLLSPRSVSGGAACALARLEPGP